MHFASSIHDLLGAGSEQEESDAGCPGSTPSKALPKVQNQCGKEIARKATAKRWAGCEAKRPATGASKRRSTP
jgi:hypothetical protein